MNRRKFLKTTGILSGSILLTPLLGSGSVDDPDVIIASGVNPSQVCAKAVSAFDKFQDIISVGSTVLIKPTIQWNKGAETGYNTNPEIVKQMVVECIRAGAKSIFVLDNSTDSWTKCYKNSGIEKAAKQNMARVLPPDNDNDYVEIIPGSDLKVHRLYKECDVVINLVAAGVINELGYFGSIQNLAGITSTRTHNAEDLLKLIKYRTPEITIVDAFKMVNKNNSVLSNSVIVSTNQIAADVETCKLLGISPYDSPLLKRAAQKGFCVLNNDALRVRYISD